MKEHCREIWKNTAEKYERTLQRNPNRAQDERSCPRWEAEAAGTENRHLMPIIIAMIKIMPIMIQSIIIMIAIINGMKDNSGNNWSKLLTGDQ